MINRTAILLMVLFSFCVWAVNGTNLVQAQNPQDFRVASFVADYYLDRTENGTSTLKVQEVIEVEFPNYDQNHGILRAIPESYQGHTLNLNVEVVTNINGGRQSYTTYKESGNLVLKIGDLDKYVHGKQTYRIAYTMRNVVAFFDDHEEFYWDINGNEWSQPFGMVTARIHIPPAIAGSMQERRSCFVGTYGRDDAGRCNLEIGAGNQGEQVITVSAVDLSAKENVSVVLGFNKDTFIIGPEIAEEELWRKVRLGVIAAGILLPPILTGFWVRSRWHRYGRDPAGKGVIIPEYQPPKNLNSLQSDVILHEELRNQAISAMTVELAVRKYITIAEVKKTSIFGKNDYELELKADMDNLNPEEQKVLKMFFGDASVIGDKVKLSKLKNKLHQQVHDLGIDMGNKLYKEGYFRSDPNKTRKRYITYGSILLIIGFLMAVVTGQYIWPLAIGVFLSGLVIMAVSKTMPARSKLGVTTRDYLLGLRDYMRLAEEDRIKFLQSPTGAEKTAILGDHNDPKEQIKLFEKLLPYAMLFGLEKDWAKQFEDIYTQPPDWYQGDWQNFNAIRLASSLGGFNSVSAASFTAPSSSGSSGFSGGGFSGGGGGGGGGGGW